MKLLILRTHDMTTEPVVGGLESLELHDVRQYVYDEGPLPVDGSFLDAADIVRPDAIILFGSNDPRFMASASTLQRLRKIAPLCLLAFDGSDASWIPVLRDTWRDCFDMVVNIDGNDSWPKGPKDYTALTPTDHRPYQEQQPLLDRPVKFGFAGGYSSPSRRNIVEFLVERAGLVIPRRNEQYGSYAAYARFMCSCQIVLNVPMSGNEQMQVKGRVLETGAAGGVLLEMAGSKSDRWFSRHQHYAEYKDREHALDVIQHLVASPMSMRIMAESLRLAVDTSYSPKVFWNKLFERLMP